MDFFDPAKQKRHTIRLYIGYAFAALGVVLATTILLYQAYGYGVDRKGRVIQNGLVFLSSSPKGGRIYVNDKRYKSDTNTRMVLPAGQYKVRVLREGYRPWQRAMTVEGGSVERFDYLLLFPAKLVSELVRRYTDTPSLVTQSPDRRWLVVASPGTTNSFELFDLKADSLQPKTFTISGDILGVGTTTGWQLVTWADDNRHVILRRSYHKDDGDGSEYILVDRADATQNRNLSQLLGFTPTSLELRTGAYDQYYAFDQANGTVFTATLKKPTPQLYLENVHSFTANENTVLYTTAKDASPGTVQIRVRHADDPSYVLRTVPAGMQYLLDIAVYDGTPYIAAGAQGENKVYVYQDPLAVLRRKDGGIPVPVQILKVTAPTYLTFSDNARYVMAENGDHFSVYDAEADRGYAYQIKTPLDAPMAHAVWADGYHMAVVSAGQLRIFDYDGANAQTLTAASPAYGPLFTPDFKRLLTLNGQSELSVTSLLTPKDQ